MKRIRVAINGSKTAGAALDAGVELAAKRGSELVFAHVVSVLDFAPRSDGVETPPARVPRAEDDAALSAAVALAVQRGSRRRPSCWWAIHPNRSFGSLVTSTLT